MDGWPWRIDFSRADSRLIASKGRATSINLRFLNTSTPLPGLGHDYAAPRRHFLLSKLIGTVERNLAHRAGSRCCACEYLHVAAVEKAFRRARVHSVQHMGGVRASTAAVGAKQRSPRS